MAILNHSNGIERVDVLNEIFWKKIYKAPEEALPLAKEALALSDQLNYANGIIDAQNRLGIYYDVIGKYDSAIVHYEIALSQKDISEYPKKIASTLNNIGLTYWHIGDYKKSLEYYLKSLKYFQDSGDKKGLGSAYNNIGLIYKDWKNYSKSLEFQLKAMKLREEINDAVGLGASLTNIGLLYDLLNEPEQAIIYLKKSIELKEENNDLYGLALSHNGLGSILFKLDQYDDAFYHYQQTLSLSGQIQDKHAEMLAYLGLYEIYNKKGQTDNALKAVDKALSLSAESDSRKLRFRLYYALSDIYAGKGDYQNAYKYFQLYNGAKDSVYNEQQMKQINDLQTNFEIEKGKNEIDLLTRQKKIQSLQIEKQQLLLERRNIFILALIALFFIVLLIGYNFYQRKELKQKAFLHAERLKQHEMRSRAMMEAEDRERKRIGTELHDGLGHLLSILKLNLSAYNEKYTSTADDREIYVSNATQVVDDLFREVRSISHNMMSDVVVAKGLVPAVQGYLDKINTTGIYKVNFESIGVNGQIDAIAQNVLFRVVQEALNNIIKHADASDISLQFVAHEKELTIMIEDNGKGFDQNLIQGSGIGLKNMQSRIEGLNGTLFLDSAPGRGTIITIDVPIK